MKKYTMHVMSHTHWDREWYQPFQGYRRRLVFQIDGMMDLLDARPEFPCFHLDGQTSILDDYLAINPEGKRRLARLIRKHRVLIGPWFTMPDESLLSGESLIRNLQLGHALCREWRTRPMPIGWVSDVFSHVSQLPQILSGFGIDNAFMHHGTPCEDHETSEMVWEGADGTEILLLKTYPQFGYQDFLQMRYRDGEAVRDFEAQKQKLASTDVLFAFDGNDHEPAKWNTPETIARMNRLLVNTRAVHSSLPEYLAALKKALGRNWQQGRMRFKGELRHHVKRGNWNGVSDGIGSSRLPLKQAHDQVEILLARVAEPLHGWATLLGAESRRAYVDLAWRYLFLNQAHDSICACSIDQAHRDMIYRFDQARMLAEDGIDEAIQEIGDRIDAQALGKRDHVVTVFNAGGAASDPVPTITFEIDSATLARKQSGGLAPTLVDARGRVLPYEIVRIEEHVRPKPFMYYDTGVTPALWRRDYPVHRFHVRVVESLPAMGYRSWRIAFRKPKKEPMRLLKGLQAVRVDTRRLVLDNGLVRLVPRKDGCVDLKDKVSGVWFRGLNAFEDCGDAGHGWNHSYPTKDTVVSSLHAGSRGRVSIACESQGVLAATIRVSFDLKVPEDLVRPSGKHPQDGSRTSRSRRLVEIPVETTFTVTAGSRRVDCVTSILNVACCHRLRAMFPTRCRTDVWFGDSALDVVRRSVKLQNTTGYIERAREECPIKNFVAACDDRAGLAVLTKGLYEAAVRDDKQRTIALTLFRGFVERLNFEDTEDSLLLGPLTMEYALLPFDSVEEAPPPDIFGEVDRYKLPLPSYSRPSTGMPVDPDTLRPYDAAPANLAPSVGEDTVELPARILALLRKRKMRVRNLPTEASLVDIPGNLALSTIKSAEHGDALIVRIYNPGMKRVRGVLKTAFRFKEAFLADLTEKRKTGLPFRGRQIKVDLKAKQFVTLRLET